MGKKRQESKIKSMPVDPYFWESQAAIKGLQGLLGAFPTEAYQQLLPGIEQFAGYIPGVAEGILGPQGMYSGEQMRNVFMESQMPGLQLANRGIRNLLMGQVAAGKARPGTALETMAKQARGGYAEAWKGMPELMAKQAQTQLAALQGIPQAYSGAMKAYMMPSEYQRGLYKDILAGTTAQPKGQYGEQEQKGTKSYGWGLFEA